MSKIDLSNVDIDAMIAELQQTFDTLQKNINDETVSLQKMDKEESSKEESSKEESSKEESSKEASMEQAALNKEEGSSYESQAPEASEAAPAPEASAQPEQEIQPDAQPEMEQPEEMESLLSSIPEESLQQLLADVQAEIAKRGQADQPEAQPEAQPEVQPEAQPDMDQQPDPSLALKAEKEEAVEKLSKAEKENAELKQYVEILASNLNKVLAKPQPRAISDISAVKMVPKDNLNKSELSAAELNKKVSDIAKDPRKLEKLSKSQIDAVAAYRFDKKISKEILEIIK